HRQGRASPRLSAALFHRGGTRRVARRGRSPDRSPTRTRVGPLKGASPSRASQARMRPTGFSFLIHLRESSIMENVKGKSVAVLVEKFYEGLDLWYPVLRLREAGCTVRIVGPKAGETYSSKHGYPAKADAAASEVKAADFDAIVIPGGYSPDHMRRHKE